MQEFLDRLPSEGKVNRKKIIHEDGTSEYVIIESADDPIQTGTPINRGTMMAVQGYEYENVEFDDNSIIKTNADGHKETITFKDNQIIKKFAGEKTITQTTTFTETGYVKELS